MNSNNYTGPYWSDGKFQSSVEFGKTPPGSALDAESRLHDSAYAHFKDSQHRIAADYIYNSRVEKFGFKGQMIGSAVMIGNQVLRAGFNVIDGLMTYGPLGLVVGAVEDAYYVADYGLNHDKYEKEVLDYYSTDPGFQVDVQTPYVESKGTDIVKKTGIRPTVTKPLGNKHSSEAGSPPVYYIASTYKKRKRRRRKVVNNL